MRGQGVNQGQVPLVPDKGHIARNKGHTEASSCLFGTCGPFRDFREVCSMGQRWPLVSNSLSKKFKPVPMLDGVDSQRIIRVERF